MIKNTAIAHQLTVEQKKKRYEKVCERLEQRIISDIEWLSRIKRITAEIRW